MKLMHYLLDADHNVVEVPDLLTWARAMETFERRVAKTEISETVEVSTVFLGLDHNWRAYGPPILFETMVFGGEHNEKMDRYATWDEALSGHAAMVKRCTQ